MPLLDRKTHLLSKLKRRVAFRSDPAEEANDPLDARWLGWATPGIVMLVVFFALPLLMIVLMSFYRDAGLGRLHPEFTFHNYIRFFGDSFYLGILWETVKLGLVVVTLCVLLAYPVAYFLARTQSRFRGYLVFVVVAPLFISVVIRNLGWVPMLSSGGVVNWTLLQLGIISSPLILINNFTGVVIGLTHTMLPFMILMLIPVIQRIDPSVEEASLNLGATPWQTFIRVVLPLSRPGLIGGYLLVLTTSIAAFTTPAVLGGRRVLVMPVYIEQLFRSSLQYGFGATVTTILLVTSIIFTLVSLRRSARDA